MGRLLNEQEIVRKNVQAFVERSTSEYSRFLDGAAPSFTTYFRKNILKSTTDLGLENAEKILGTNSPVTFDKIDSLPIYGIDPFSLSMEKTEKGADTSISGEGIIVPTTIKPLPDDYFSIDYIGQQYLFKITEVQPDRIEGKMFYKIMYTFDKILGDDADILEQVKESYVCILTNIGTDHKAILPTNDYLNLQYLEEVYMEYFKFYTDYFYDKRYNIFTLKDNFMYIYNQFLYEFSSRTEIFKPIRSFLNDFYIKDAIPKGIDFLSAYKTTIYYALEKQSTADLTCMRGFLQPMKKNHTQFRYAYQKFMDVTFIPHEARHINDDKYALHLLKNFNKEFYSNIKTGTRFEDNEKFLLENIIISYLNKDIILTEQMLDQLSEYDLFPNFKTFLMIPLVLYVLRFLRNRILNKID